MLFIAFYPKKEAVDSRPFEGTSNDYTSSARIVGGEELFREIGGGQRYDSLARDLFVFGKSQIDDYKKADAIVGFEIKSALTVRSNEIDFSGNYGSSKDRILVKLIKRPNGRLTSSIKNEKTGVSIDQDLPSNSKRNSFIATLPLIDQNYTIEYLAQEDIILISIYERNQSIGDVAYQRVLNETGESAGSNTISMSFPPPAEYEQSPDYRATETFDQGD